MKTVGVMLALCLSFLLSSCYLLEANTLIFWLNEDELEKVVDLSKLEGSPLVDDFHHTFLFRPLDDLDKIHFIAHVCKKDTLSMHYFSLDPSNEHYAVQEVMPGFAEEFGSPLYLGIYHGDCWLLEDRELWTYHLDGFVSYDLKDEVTTIVNNNIGDSFFFHRVRDLYFHENKLYFTHIGDTTPYNPSKAFLYSIDFPSLDPSTLTQHFSLKKSSLNLGSIAVIKSNKMYWIFYRYASSEKRSQGIMNRGIVEIDLDTQEKRVIMEIKEQESRENGIIIQRDLGWTTLNMSAWFGKYWMFREIMGKNNQAVARNYHIFNTEGTLHCIVVSNPELSFKMEFLKTHHDGTYFYFFKDGYTLYRWKVPII